MLVLKTLLITSVSVALAAPVLHRGYSRGDIGARDTGMPDLQDRAVYGLGEIEVRDLDTYNLDARALDMFGDLEVREFFQDIGLEARTDPKFAVLSNGDKKKATAFVGTITDHKIQDAASPNHSARTFHKEGGFHFDRQQPETKNYASKVAVQLDHAPKKGPTTVGQVAIQKDANPSPELVRSELLESIKDGKEHVIEAPAKTPA